MGKLSDKSEHKTPNLIPSLREFVQMLSIKVAVFSLTVVGL